VNNEQLTFISTAGFQSYVHLWCSRPASHTVRGGFRSDPAGRSENWKLARHIPWLLVSAPPLGSLLWDTRGAAQESQSHWRFVFSGPLEPLSTQPPLSPPRRAHTSWEHN